MTNTLRPSGGRKASTTVVTIATTSVSSDATRTHVLVSDADLVARAQATLRSIQFESLTDLSRYDWKWRESKNDFTLFTRQPTPSVSASRRHEVLAAGEISCSLEEAMHVLRSTAESDYNAAMAGLYKKKFVYGSVVRVLPHEDVATSELHVTDKTHLAVKTAAFVRSRLLAKNEQWCFLECFQELPQEQPKGFTLTQSSMLPSELTTGKAERSQVTQLHGIQLGYSVQQVPGRKCVCVLFHAAFDGQNTDIYGNATTALTKARMLLLAKGVARIPEIVRRRRLGAQTISNHKAFTANNSRCICCTSSLRMFSIKRRCLLCGYLVCDKCWSLQDFETRNANVTTLIVCNRCVEFVDEADYSAVPPGQLGPPRVLPSANSGEETGHLLLSHLKEALRTAKTSARKNSVLAVIKHLVGSDPSSSSASANAKSEQEYLDSLNTYFKVQPVPLEQCVLANAESRSYPLDLRDDPAMDVPKYPMPRNEAKRQQAIERSSVLDLGETPELDLICTLAARELGCAASFVNIITNDKAVVLASNVDEYRRLVLEREHVYCSHTVLDSRPLVLPNPQADIRFCNFRPFKEKAGIKFYCGFPLLAEDNETVIGTVCCLDNSSKEITQEQYAVMDRLTRVATKVVQRQTKQHQLQSAPVPSPA